MRRPAVVRRLARSGQKAATAGRDRRGRTVLARGSIPPRSADARGRRPTGDQPDRATANDPCRGGATARAATKNGRTLATAVRGPGKREVER